MTDLAGRLSRRAQGGASALIPSFPDRPADPRFGPTTSSTDFFGEAVEDPFAAALPVERAATSMHSPQPASSPAPVVAPAPASIEHWRETTIVRETQSAPPSRAAAVPVGPRTSVASPSLAARPDPVSTSPSTTSPSTTSTTSPSPLAADAPTRQVVAPTLTPGPRLPFHGTKRAAPPGPAAAEPQPATSRSADIPAASPVVPAAPAIATARPPVAALPASPHRAPSLEPRPGPPRASIEAAPEPAGPRVVIGNLHIEVVRAPAAPAPRREAPRSESPRAARPAATPTRARRRTTFGLGQL